MALNHPSSSKNITGGITNHHYATLPGLQPVHDGDSHKQDIPAKSIQFVTTNNDSSNCSCSRPHQSFFHFSAHQSFFHFSEKHEVSSLKCTGFTGRLSPPPHQSLSHLSQQHLVPPLRCIGFTAPSSISIIHDFPGMNDTTHSKIPPTPYVKNKETPILLLTWIQNYGQSTDIHSRPSRNR